MKSLKIVLHDTVFEMNCDILDRFQLLMKQLLYNMHFYDNDSISFHGTIIISVSFVGTIM